MDNDQPQQPTVMVPGTSQAGGWRPTKRRAFLGDFAPAFFDHAYIYRPDGRIGWPNAVLENANGLALCYDELWFLKRRHCPADMQNLDFVKFVSDDPQLAKTAEEAGADGLRMLRALWAEQHADGPGAAADPARNRKYARRWAQHSRLRDHLTHAMESGGYTCSLAPIQHTETPWLGVWADLHQLSQFLIADALGLGPMDVIINSGSGVLPSLWQTTGGDDLDGAQFHATQITAIEEILHLRSAERLTPRGAYHGYISDLRSDKRIKDLREFLTGRPSPAGTATALAQQVEQLIDAARDEALRIQHRPTLLRTLGTMALGSVGNYLFPGLGSLSNLLNADRVISDFKFRSNTRWAMFVVDARSHVQAHEDGKNLRPSAIRPRTEMQ
ncbi:hypothetical protein ACGF7W_34765 [Streptomyces sp. NPDC048219]|uniref:hypothetical protein n=1 Tax=Streptomyces sp. NPDC048219 TaxID=3365517 RepID=UPI003719671E